MTDEERRLHDCRIGAVDDLYEALRWVSETFGDTPIVKAALAKANGEK